MDSAHVTRLASNQKIAGSSPARLGQFFSVLFLLLSRWTRRHQIPTREHRYEAGHAIWRGSVVLSPSTATGGCSSEVDRFDSTEIFPATLAQNPPAVAQHLSVTARHNRQLSTASTPCDNRPLCPRRQRTHTVCRHRGALIMASRTDLPSTSPAWKPDSMTDTRCLADGALRGPAAALHAACGAIGGVGGASAWPQLPIFHLNTNLRLLAGSAVIKKGSPQAGRSNLDTHWSSVASEVGFHSCASSDATVLQLDSTGAVRFDHAHTHVHLSKGGGPAATSAAPPLSPPTGSSPAGSPHPHTAPSANPDASGGQTIAIRPQRGVASTVGQSGYGRAASVAPTSRPPAHAHKHTAWRRRRTTPPPPPRPWTALRARLVYFSTLVSRPTTSACTAPAPQTSTCLLNPFSSSEKKRKGTHTHTQSARTHACAAGVGGGREEVPPAATFGVAAHHHPSVSREAPPTPPPRGWGECSG